MKYTPQEYMKKLYDFLQEDTLQSWLVSIILIVIFIKLIFFPALSWLTGTPLPIVIVESCSMYHNTNNFDSWWNANSPWYTSNNITKEEFTEFSLKNGLNKGDIVILTGSQQYEKGDILIFTPNTEASTKNPIIHRIVKETPLATKGDNNPYQFTKSNNVQSLDETNISQTQIIGKARLKIPILGWFKLIFFEPTRPASQRGLCN